jgi:hypothetical protein
MLCFLRTDIEDAVESWNWGDTAQTLRLMNMTKATYSIARKLIRRSRWRFNSRCMLCFSKSWDATDFDTFETSL